MSYINKVVLDKVFYYKSVLDNELNKLLSYINDKGITNFYNSPNYKIYLMISTNIVYDLNYLLNVNPSLDNLGLVGLYRNVRNSIEAYYDLHILTMDNDYISMLKVASNHAEKNQNDYTIAKRKFCKGKSLRLTMPQKADIATTTYKLNPDNVNKFKEVSMLTNSYIHPDIFAPTNYNKSFAIQEVLGAECQLLCLAFELIIIFVQNSCGYYTEFNCYKELNALLNDLALNNYPIILGL